MDYFTNVLFTFLGLECVSCIAIYAGSESSDFIKKYLKLCSNDEQRNKMDNKSIMLFQKMVFKDQIDYFGDL